LAVASRLCWRVFQPLLRCLRLRHNISAWAFGSPTGGRRLAGDEQLGRCTAEQSKYCRLHLYSGKLALAAMYIRRVRVVSRSSAAALANVSTAISLPAPRAQNLGVSLQWPCRGLKCGGMLGAKARTAPARPATPRWTRRITAQSDAQVFRLAQSINSAESPV